MPAVAYLRRSRVDTRRDGAMSHEQQLSAVRALALAHGDDPDALEIIEDWGKSGRAEKQHLRTGFARLEAMVADGQASAVYAYSANRLARSLEALARLAKLCETHGVPIRCADGYSPDVTTSTGRMVLGILGSVYAWQAEWTQERAQEVTAVRRGRGDHLGPAPFGFRVVDGQLVDRPEEDLDLVVAAYRSQGSFQGAARKLTLDGVPTRTGRMWIGSTVWGILVKQAPDELPPKTSRRRASTSFRLSGLLRCPHDGSMLTGQTYRGRWVGYACRKAGEDPHHPRPRTISESKVLPWVVDEVRRLRVPDHVEADPEAEARRPALEARRERVTEAFLDGAIDKVRRDQELLTIADELEALSDRAVVLDVPAVDWSWPPEQLAPVLRAILDHVELGPDLRPVSAVWRVPEWRS